MSRCLITGHRGFIGSILYKKLKNLGHEVMGIDQNDIIKRDVRKTLRQDSDDLFHAHFLNFQPPLFQYLIS